MSFIPWRNKKPEGGQVTSPLAALRTEMDRLFDSFMRDPMAGIDWALGRRGMWVPSIDVTENEQEVTIRAEMPGMDPVDIDISLMGNQLVVAGDKKASSERTDKGYGLSECSYGSFRRSIPIPETIDPEKVQADYQQGVLTIVLKKSQPTPAKKIQVRSSPPPAEKGA